MKLKYWLIFFFISYPFVNSYGQNSTAPIKIFKLYRFSGNLQLDGYYNYKSLDNLGVEDKYNMSYISPTINLKTNNYIFHPNLLTIDFNVNFNPSLKTNVSDIHPDRIEKTSHKGFDLSAKLLKNKNYSIYSNFRLHDSYYNDEDISYTKTLNKHWDIKFLGKDKRLPMSIVFSNTNSESENITNNRNYSFDTKTLDATINKTFFKKDAHRINYKFNNDKRAYSSQQVINTEAHYLNLNNRLYFDKRNKYSFSSNITEKILTGDHEIKEFYAMENFLFIFPENLKLNVNYTYRNQLRNNSVFKENYIFSNLDHKLFQSLRSSIFYSIGNSKQKVYNQQRYNGGISLSYIKKIPTGKISLIYSFSAEKMNRQNESELLQVTNEEHIISDGEILLLNYPFADRLSVVVKSMNQILIYQENLDYYIIDQGDYIEIQRVPGGQIDNNSVVYIDYEAERVDASSYNLNRQGFTSDVSVLKQLISVYYKYNEDVYSDVEFESINSFEDYKQHIVGIGSRSKIHKAGVEYKNRESNLVPLKQIRYYANMQIILKKIQFYAGASHNYYFKYGLYNSQSYLHSSAKVIYSLGSNTKIEYEFNYRKQDGDNVFLDLVKSRVEYASKIRSFSYSGGVEFFHKDMIRERSNLFGVFIKARRYF